MATGEKTAVTVVKPVVKATTNETDLTIPNTFFLTDITMFTNTFTDYSNFKSNEKNAGNYSSASLPKIPIFLTPKRCAVANTLATESYFANLLGFK